MNSRVRHIALRAVRYALIPVLAFLALSAWALSSPVGSSPDEDFHLASIWCAQGIETGVCEPSTRSDERRVFEALPHAPTCYATLPETSAACQSEWFAPESRTLVSTERGNFSGDYPPTFYSAMSLLAGDDISRSVVAMRLANAAVFVGMMTALYWLLPRGRRTMLTVGAGVALVPLGVFIIPSVNPSSWAVISGAAVFPSMVGFFEVEGRRRWALAGIAVVATVLGAGARADAAVYAALATVLAAVVSGSVRRGSWRLFALPLVLLAVCAASYLSSGQSEAASVGFDGASGPPPDLSDHIGQTILNVPQLWAGALGFYGLGWLDTAMPSVVWVINLATFGGVVYLGMRRTGPRKTVAVVGALLAAWAIPSVVLVQSSLVVGAGVQPRYLLPLLVLLAQVALFRTDLRLPELSRAQLVTAALGLTATNAVSLHFNIRRYVTGTDVFAFDLDPGREWWWGLGASPMAVWWVGAVSFGATLLICVRALAPREDGPPGRPPAEREVDRDDVLSETAPVLAVPPLRPAY